MNARLVVGSKQFSSWSLRPWLLAKQFDIPFAETVIPLYHPETPTLIRQHSPSGRVPVLIDGTLQIWDSLAIAEYWAEIYPERQLWPQDRAARAACRSVSAEMHSGFSALRQQLSMDVLKRVEAPELKADTASDVKRIQEIWTECLQKSGGPFLFGAFSIADAMFAPVVTRFQTYTIPLPPDLDAYQKRILDLPAMKAWIADAEQDRSKF